MPVMLTFLLIPVKDEFIKLHKEDFNQHFEQIKENNNISDDAINVAWRHSEFGGGPHKSKLQAYCNEHGIDFTRKDTVKKLKEKNPNS